MVISPDTQQCLFILIVKLTQTGTPVASSPGPPATSLRAASPELHTGCVPKLCLKVSLGLRSLFPWKQCNKWKLTQGAVPPSLPNPQCSWDWVGSGSILFPLPPPPTPLIPSAPHTAMASDLPHFMTQRLKPYFYPRTPYQIKVQFYPLNLSLILMGFFSILIAMISV